MHRYLIALAIATILDASAWAGSKSAAAREVVEYLAGKGLAKSAQTGLAQRIEAAAIAAGDDVFRAVRRGGIHHLQLIEQAGPLAARAATLLAVHGEAAAVHIVRKPEIMALVVRLGDDAAVAIVRHPGPAEKVLHRHGAPAAPALAAIDSRSALRLAEMAHEAPALWADPRTFPLIARSADRAVTFLWHNRRWLHAASAINKFLDEPEPYIDGTRSLDEAPDDKPVVGGHSPPTLEPESFLLYLLPVLLAAVAWTIIFVSRRKAPTVHPGGHTLSNTRPEEIQQQDGAP